MLTYRMYTEVIDEIALSGDISKALIEDGEEDSMICVQKHIGHAIKVIMETNRLDHMACNNMLNTLLKRHGGPHACKQHAFNTIDEINHKLILFVATNTQFDGRYQDDPADDPEDDFEDSDAFIDIDS